MLCLIISLSVYFLGSGYTIVNDFFLATVKKIYSILDTNLPGVNKVLKTCISDLQHLKKMHRAFAPAAEFFSIFLQCQLLLRKCRTDRAWSIPAALATNECSSLQNDVKDLLKLSYKLEFMFSGLSTENLFTVKAVSFHFTLPAPKNIFYTFTSLHQRNCVIFHVRNEN